MTVPKRFGVLRLWGWILKIVAWIILIFSILGAIGAVAAPNAFFQFLGITAESNPAFAFINNPVGVIMVGIGALLIGVFDFLIIFALGEQMHMQLAIEENTRLTAALLLRMHQDSQQEARSGSYGGGFESERYER